MKRGLFISTAVGALAIASVAGAQEAPKGVPYLQRAVPAPDRALEIGVGLGFDQGIGSISGAPGDNLRSLGGAGTSGEIDIGYRATPNLMIGVYGTGAQFAAGATLPGGTNTRSMTAGVQANYHFMPYKATDPWVGLGTGFRGYWVVPPTGGITSREGWEIARAQAGVDLRLSPEVAVGPMIGADVSTFLAEKVPGGAFGNIASPKLNTFVFAGVSGRFDLIGNAVTRATNVASE